MINRKSRVNTNRSRRSLFDTAKQRGEHAWVDRNDRSVAGSGLGQLEERAMETLVEDAVAVGVEPQHLHSVAPFAGEDEERSALRVQDETLLHDERQGVERPAH